MKYLIEFILVLPVNILMAWWHSRLIKAGKEIRHVWWASAYASLTSIAVILLEDDLPSWRVAAFAGAILLGRLPVFNITLNLIRGKKWNYSSPTTTSIIDQMERRLFGGRVWIAEVVAGAICITLTFFV